MEDVANGSNRCRLQEQVRRLVSHFERPHLIIEADRPSRDQQRWRPSVPGGGDASSAIFKPTSPYLCLTLATLTQTNVTILHSNSQGKSQVSTSVQSPSARPRHSVMEPLQTPPFPALHLIQFRARPLGPVPR